MSSWYTAKLEGDSNTIVTISGEGADEILAGYLRYITYYFANLSLKKIFSSYHLFKSTSNAKSYLWLGIFANITEKIIGKNLTQYLYELTGRKEKLFTPLNQKLAEDIFSCLVNLHHVDERAFMAHSIEHRTPFMDYRLIEFLATIPAAYKIAKGWTKYLARYVFDKRLPDNIIWSKDKLGWPIPEKFWFEGELKNWLETTIQNSEFLKKHQFTSENMSLLQKIRLLNIAIWHDVFFN
jgi:asparagine synthase (glutamine-hydrolysing)